MSTTIDLMRERLLAAFAPVSLQIHDDSAQHQGHAGARSGGGHYRLEIVSTAFEGKPVVARHRLVFAALGDLMQQRIHALGVNAKTPAEARAPA